MYSCTISKQTSENEKILTNHLIQMAIDSENLVLDRSIVEAAIKNILSNPKRNYYICLVRNDENENKIIGMNLVYYEYNIMKRKRQHWIGSLFITEEYRRKRLFKDYILKYNVYQLQERINNDSDESCLGKYNGSIKLYVDIDNKQAIETYKKTGFTQINTEIIYESFVNQDTINNFKFLDKNIYHFQFMTKENLSSITDFLIRNNKENEVSGLEFLLNNNDLYGNVIVLYKNLDIVGVLYIFYEPSDWRNNVIWWVYHIYFIDDYKESNCLLKLTYEKIINSLVIFNRQENGCVIRFCLSSYDSDINSKNIDTDSYYNGIFENTLTNKSHYLIYEKEIS